MAGTRSAARLLISDEQRAELVAIANSLSLPHRAVRQAQGLLDAADGVANEEIGRRCGVSANTVRAWRASFARRGVAGVGVVAEGRGRKPWLPAGMVEQVVRVTLTEKPADGSTHWSTRTLAARLGISHGAVANIWRDHGLQPWKVDTFKLSTDPDFEAKLVDVVGLHLDPPAKAAVMIRVEVRDLPPLACRSRVAKLRAAEPGGAGDVGAALKKPGRVRIARWRGFGERGGEEYVRNQRDYVP
jgi:transposase